VTPQQQDWLARIELGLLVAVWVLCILILRHRDWLEWLAKHVVVE